MNRPLSALQRGYAGDTDPTASYNDQKAIEEYVSGVLAGPAVGGAFHKRLSPARVSCFGNSVIGRLLAELSKAGHIRRIKRAGQTWITECLTIVSRRGDTPKTAPQKKEVGQVDSLFPDTPVTSVSLGEGAPPLSEDELDLICEKIKGPEWVNPIYAQLGIRPPRRRPDEEENW